MGLGITTIYYQVRKFKPKMHKDFNVGELTDFEIGELMGAFAGDGSFYHKKYDSIKNNDSRYRTRYHLSLVTDINYLNYLSDLLKKMNLNPIISHREEDNSIVLNINSKDFYKLIREYLTWEEDKTFTIRLLKPIQIYSEDFLRGFARGLMDTDGFLNEGNAGCACISEELINNLAGVYKLYNFDISRSRIIRDGNRRPIFYIRVLRKSLKNFGEVMKVAIVCDFLTKLGGAQKVLMTLHELYPNAPIYCLLYSEKGTKGQQSCLIPRRASV